MSKVNESVKELAERIASKVASEVSSKEVGLLLNQLTKKIEGQIAEGIIEKAKNQIDSTNNIIKEQNPESGFVAILTKNGEIAIPYGKDVTFTIKLTKDNSDFIEEYVYNVDEFDIVNLKELLGKIKKYDYCEFSGDNIKEVTMYDEKVFDETRNLKSCEYKKVYHKIFYGFCRTEDMVSIYKTASFFDK